MLFISIAPFLLILILSREDDLREGFPMPHQYNFLKSINNFAPCCESYFYFLLNRGSDIMFLELTNQVALLK